MNERRDPVLPNFYKEFKIDYLASPSKINRVLEAKENEAKQSKNKELYYKVMLAKEYLGKPKMKETYDNYLKRNGVKFPLTKKEKRRVLIIGTIITGIIIGAGVGTGMRFSTRITSREQKNLNSNVCVEYQIKEGDTKTELENEYGIIDMCFSYMETTGAYRQLAAKEANVDIHDFLAVNDVIIGRTTEENAEKLVNEKGAEIITIEEAVDILEKSGLNSFVSEFKKAAEGKSIIQFHIPTKEKVLG